VTRPSRIASDLLYDNEDPEAVGHVVADAVREVYDYPGTFADSLGPHAAKFGLRRGDGIALLRWLLDLVGNPDTPRWLDEAIAHVERAAASPLPTGRVLDDALAVIEPFVNPLLDGSALGNWDQHAARWRS
jgi:hypothetical protein